MKKYFDMDFLKEFVKSFLSLLFALASLLLGGAISGFITPQKPVVDVELAERNVTQFMELQHEIDRVYTINTAWNSFFIAIAIILFALTLTLIVAWYLKKKKK